MSASPLVQSLTQPNGSVTTYQYDIVNRLTQMTTTLSGNILTQYTYTYNAQDLRDAENYIEPQPRAAYSNELDYYTCNDVNELTTINNPGQKDLVYDASGNLVQGYTPAGYQFTAAYDSANHLTSFTYTDGNGVVNNTQYTYLGNLLLEKTQYMNGTKTGDTRYVFDGSQATQERNGNNNVVNEYTWGLGLPGGIGGLLQLVQTNTLYSYLYDGKGNVTALLNAAGQPAAAYQYDPFGQPQTLLASITQPMGFSTKAYDPQTGLSYYGYRFYSPSLGRWLTRDPLGEIGGINLYAFVQNNPVNAIDPEGLVLWGQVALGFLQAADATVMAGTAFAATVGTAAITGNVPLAALICAEMLPLVGASGIEAIHAYHNIYEGLTDEMPLQNQPCLAN